MKQTLHIVVNGRVQGVYFRANTQKQALKVGLSGYVRNLENGDVEIVATGTSSQIDSLVKWCHKGPILAKVLTVKTTEMPLDNDFISFEIR